MIKNNASKIIDVYSGVGGLSLGATRAGFDLLAAVEVEKRILESHAKNFPLSKHLHADVSKLNKTLINEAIGPKIELAGLIGGPPCQGFSTIGKRNINDNRNNLFIDFFRLASELRPAFFLAENVPGILNDQYDQIRKRAESLVEDKYKLLKPIVINASHFGAATTRTRVFFIGVRQDILGADRIVDNIEFQKTSSVIVREALKGLPKKISSDWQSYETSWQKTNDYNNEYLNSLNNLLDGIGDIESIKRFEKTNEVSGCFGTRHSPEVANRYALLRPGQQDPISKSVKLKENGHCPTLRAGTDNSKGSYQAVRPIHPTEARVITPREAARLQGFPDWFQFHHTKWHSFRQIGNSVCPIAAEKVLSAIKMSLSI